MTNREAKCQHVVLFCLRLATVHSSYLPYKYLKPQAKIRCRIRGESNNFGKKNLKIWRKKIVTLDHKLIRGIKYFVVLELLSAIKARLVVSLMGILLSRYNANCLKTSKLFQLRLSHIASYIFNSIYPQSFLDLEIYAIFTTKTNK